MINMALTVIVCTLCIYVCSVPSFVECRRETNKYTELDRSLDASHSDTGLTFTHSEVLRLRELFKKLPMANSQLKTFHELINRVEGDLHLNMAAIIPDMDHFKEHVLADSEFRAEFLKALRKQNIAKYVDAWSDEDVNLDPEDIPADVRDRNQTQGWEGCRVDYDMVILPVTEGFRRQLIVWWNENVDLINPPGLPLDLIDIPIPDWNPRRNPVALPLIDAHARRPTGIFEGNLHWAGTVEECHDTGVRWTYTDNATGVTERREFIGKYARLDIPVVTSTASVFSNLTFPLVWPFAIGACVPDTCSNDDIARYVMEYNKFLILFMTEGLDVFNRNITWVYTGQPIDLPNDVPALVVLGIILTIAAIGLVSACYDGWGRHRIIRNKIVYKSRGSKSGGHVTAQDIKAVQHYLYTKPSVGERFETAFVGFSFYSNLRHIYSSEVQSSAGWHVASLDGVKGISYLWAISGVTYLFGPIYFEAWTTSNLIAALNRATKDWRMMPTFYVYFANYSFLYVSGFLCVHMWYRAFAYDKKKLSVWLVIRYFLHRWWSIVPTGMGLVMVFAWYYRYLGDGPFTSPDVSDAEFCKESWWMILTLFNNIFNLEKQCFGWAWLYSVIWQLHVVSVLVVVPLVIKPILGCVMLALMYVAHVIMHVIWLEKSYEGELDWYYAVLQTPWCNAGPFCIGMMYAVIHNKYKMKKWHWTPVLILWICAIAGIYTVIYIPWTTFNPENPAVWSKAGQITYDFMAPQVLALCVGWIVFACENGYGGIVARLLRWKFWIFTSKMMLPFTFFLGPILSSYFTSMPTSFYMHELTITYVFYGHLITLFFYGNVIALLFTYPLSRGVIAAVRSKTRMELFLYGCHPEGLAGYTGDLEMDRALWEKEDKRFGKNVEVTGQIIDVYQGSPPHGGAAYRTGTQYDDITLDAKDGEPTMDDTPPPHYGRTNQAFENDVSKIYPDEDLIADEATNF